MAGLPSRKAAFAERGARDSRYSSRWHSWPAAAPGPPSTEGVVRAWSQALNQDDNDTAANLFAPNAKVVQGNTVLRLKTHEDAVAWNSALPCSGLITSIHSRGRS